MTKQTLTRSLIALMGVVGLLIPGTASGADCTISALDSVAGLGTQVTIDCAASAGTAVSVSVFPPDPNGVVRAGPPTNAPYNRAVTLNAEGKATLLVPSRNTVNAGQYEVKTSSGLQTTFVIIAGRPDDGRSTISVESEYVELGERATVTVTLVDRFGNFVEGVPLALLSNRATDAVRAQTDRTDERGNFAWTVSSADGGSATFTVYDILRAKQLTLQTILGFGTSLASDRAVGDAGYARLRAETYSVGQGNQDFSAIDHFRIDIRSTEIPVNQLFTFTVVALDSQDRVVEDYVKPITLTSNDASNALFPTVSFRPQDLGKRIIPLASQFKTIGEKTIEVSEQGNPQIRGQIIVRAVGESGTTGNQIQILDPPNETATNKSSILIQGRAPSFVNLTVLGGSGTVSGSSDADGVFRIELPLPIPPDSMLTRYSVLVTSESRQYTSLPVGIIIDHKPPKVESISFSPPVGKSGDQATVTVQVSDDDQVSGVTIMLDQEIKLSKTAPGTFGATFTAPVVKVYDASVIATDRAGNKSTVLTKWSVGVRGVPKVQGVRAESQPNTILLSWQQFGPDYRIVKYKIYVGERPHEYAYSQETDPTVAVARITELEAGKTYSFAVTGIDEEGHEGEKSDPVSAATYGLSLTVTPGEASLLLEWKRPANLQFAQYILQFGDDVSRLTEKRVVGGEFEAYSLRDLLDGVQYFLKITPVLVTGKPAPELAMTASGTPSGTGFHPGAPDTVPNWLVSDQTPPDYTPPPEQTPSGLSTTMLSTIAAGALLVALLVLQRFRQHRQLRMFLMAMDAQYRQAYQGHL